MNCTIWRSTSMSAPFSASSVNAIVALVIVISFKDQVGGSHLNLIRDHDGHLRRRDHQPAARRFGLRPTRLEDQKNLHHFLGHYQVMWLLVSAIFDPSLL
jgi:hypothetical protein